jgi:AAA+ ATPase superfamily predicted ATPase
MLLFDLKPKDSRKDFYDRRNTIDEIVRLLKHGSWLVVLGSRMVGKTSVIKVACSDLPRGYSYVYLNLWGVKSAGSFLEALAHGISESRTLYEKIKNNLKRVEEFSVGPDSFSIRIAREPMTRIWDIIAAMGTLKHDTVLILDEVQELYPVSGQILALLANIFNTYKNITFVFTGSMVGVVRSLLEPKEESPMYGRPPAKVDIHPFEHTDSIKFLQTGFKQYNVSMENSKIEEAVGVLGNMPGWLTMYGNFVAVRRLSHQKALQETKKQATKIIKSELDHFLKGKDKIAYIQALKACVIGASWSDVKTAINVKKRNPVNDRKVKDTIDNLFDSWYIRRDEEDGKYTVVDPLVKETIKGLR